MFHNLCVKVLANKVSNQEHTSRGTFRRSRFVRWGEFRSKENKIYIEVRFKLVSGGLTL